MICPKCGQQATYIEQYDRDYCYFCKAYVPLRPEPLGVKAVFGKAFNLLKKKPLFFIIALIPLLLNLVLSFGLSISINQFMTPMQSLVFDPSVDSLLSILYSVMIPLIIFSGSSLIVYSIINNAYLIGVKRVLKGKGLNLTKVFKKSFKRLGKYLASSLILIFILLIPIVFTLLFYAPSFILRPFITFFLVILFSYTPAIIVLEQKSIRDSFRYAWRLGLKNLGKTIKFFILTFLIIITLGVMFSFIPRPFSEYVALLTLNPLLGVAFSVLYLNGIKQLQLA